MSELFGGRRGAVLVSALLILQISLFWLSTDALLEISIFCTGPASSGLSWFFGSVHFLLLGLLLVGLFSLRMTALRLPYAGLLAASLVALIVQALLVSQGVLLCDGP